MQEKTVNRDGWLWLAPEWIDRWRVFPRAFIIFYFWLAFATAMWFMALPIPSPSQAAFAGAVISAGAAWFGLYVNSGSILSRSAPTIQYKMKEEPTPAPNPPAYEVEVPKSMVNEVETQDPPARVLVSETAENIPAYTIKR